VHIPSGWGSLRKLDELGITRSALLSDAAKTIAERLFQNFWPGPLTIILPRGSKIPDLVTSGLETVGVRMPRHALAQDLLRTLQLPLAAPSANRFGRISPTSSAAVSKELGDRVSAVLEGGPCEVGLESTILHVAPDATLTLLRPGEISREQIESLTGQPVALPDSSLKARSSAELAPGMLASHYAPRKGLRLGPLSALAELDLSKRWGLLSFRPSSALSLELRNRASRVESLTTEAEQNQEFWPAAARRLFSALRALDECDEVEAIFAEDPRTLGDASVATGLTSAILDRLTRAAAPRT
jgi:L-threonylcarbamoyladenylate synthase